MRRRPLGADGPEISVMAYGLMSLSSTYGPSDDEESVSTLHAALDAGINFLDTAEIYGGGHNERLAARVLAERRGEVVLATKFGIGIENGQMVADGRPENVRRAIDGSLERLGVDHVDLYYLHRRDPDVAIEETVGAMAELVSAGKVRRLGLSAVSSDTVRRAAKVHPIAALQSEYSLFAREPEVDVLSTCKELGITFVAFSPLGRGVLTGTLRSENDLDERDMRRASPRLQGDNLRQNLERVDALSVLAAEKGVEPGQLALAWLIARDTVPLFGTRRAARVRSNAAAADLELGADDIARIEQLAPPGSVAGAGLIPGLMRLVER
ncbi:MAG: aldo/keto reductase [Myxococcota bacterium]|nr:aldo/keto reductase [Myxococcota bacterium]